MPKKIYKVKCTVMVACPYCAFDIAANRLSRARNLKLTCDSCCEQFEIPRDAVNDAQHQCLKALGEA